MLIIHWRTMVATLLATAVIALHTALTGGGLFDGIVVCMVSIFAAICMAASAAALRSAFTAARHSRTDFPKS